MNRLLRTSNGRRAALRMMRFALIAACGMGWVAPAGYAQSPAEGVDTPEAVFTVGGVEGDVGRLVDVPIDLATFGTEATSFVLSIDYDSANLAYIDAAKGPAIPEDKLLFVNSETPGTVTFLTYGLDLVPILDGNALEMRFRIEAGSKGDVFSLTPGERVSAVAVVPDPTPEEPDAVRTVSFDVTVEPGAIEVACVPPPAPQEVTASQGRTDGVLVEWAPVTGAAGYRVYRHAEDEPEAASALGTNWQAGTTFLDTTAPASNPGGGCVGGGADGNRFYYWVKARSEPGCESLFSASAQGYWVAASAKAGGGFALLFLTGVILARRAGAARRRGRHETRTREVRRAAS